MTDLPTRDAELRRLLVSRATRSPAAHRLRIVAASVASVAVVGALAAVVVVSTNPPGGLPAGAPSAATDIDPPGFIWSDADVLGDPVVVSGAEDLTVPMGDPPEGATDLAVYLRCLEPGSYRVTLDDDEVSRSTTNCPAKDFAGGASGGYVPFHPDGPNVFSVEVRSSEGSFLIWAAWIARPEDPDPSPEAVEALADGIVTREEYVAGFERYRDCLTEAGAEIFGGDTSDEVIHYSIPSDDVDSGVENFCYVSEFSDIDRQWQVSLEG